MNSNIFSVLSTIASLIEVSQALNCYLCSTPTSFQGGCGLDDFDPKVALVQNASTFISTRHSDKFDCSTCAIYVIYGRSGPIVSRSCAVRVGNGGCTPRQQLDTSSSCCYTDYCNSFNDVNDQSQQQANRPPLRPVSNSNFNPPVAVAGSKRNVYAAAAASQLVPASRLLLLLLASCQLLACLLLYCH